MAVILREKKDRERERGEKGKGRASL